LEVISRLTRFKYERDADGRNQVDQKYSLTPIHICVRTHAVRGESMARRKANRPSIDR
jgi:hypothetical protein